MTPQYQFFFAIPYNQPSVSDKVKIFFEWNKRKDLKLIMKKKIRDTT